MAKFFGKIGFAETVELKPGVHKEIITEHEYFGDVTRLNRRLQASQDSVNDNVLISNDISIVADPFACENFHNMRYVEYMGAKWKVSNVEVLYPRLILSMGGLYNGGD